MDKNIDNFTPKISIIIPVYNVEFFLVRCLDSIFVSQTFKDFEVIAINDASTDSSGYILNEYKKKEPKLKVIHHAINKKVSIARSTGIDSSKGDYIMFVDPDDYLLPNALSCLYSKCILSEADIVVFNYLERNINGITKYIHNIKKEIITTDKLKIQKLFFATPWNKIVKRNLIINLESLHLALNMTEDLLYATEILLKAKKVCLFTDFFYVYCINSGSLTQNISPDKYLEIQAVVLRKINSITLNYNASSEFKINILNYLEKYIYISIAQSAFLFDDEKINKSELLDSFALFSEVTENRLRTLNCCLSNKYYSLFKLLFLFGFKPVLVILYKYILKQSKLKKSFIDLNTFF
jgi:glycosyltransferase involved in cell wall biosynthesis